MAGDRDDLVFNKYSLEPFKLHIPSTYLKLCIYKKLWNKHTTMDTVQSIQEVKPSEAYQ